VLSGNGTEKLGEVNLLEVSEPQQHMVQAAEVFYDAFTNEQGLDQDFIEEFIAYLLQKVVVVVVKTDSLASGFEAKTLRVWETLRV
jgi:predicted RNase H-related nuclease YkuK (DUF458 family)